MYNNIEAASDWWQEPWWEDVAYREEGLQLEAIRERIDILKRHLNGDWVRRATEAGPPNAVLPYLGPKGLLPWHALMSFARILRATEQLDGFTHKFRELIGPSSAATLFELEMAELFQRMGWHIAFPRFKTERHSDLVGTKQGQSIAIECKRLAAARGETWAQDLSLALMGEIGANADTHLHGIDFEFDPDLSDLSFDRETWNQGLVEEVIARIIAAVRSRAQITPPPERMRLAGIGEIRFQPNSASLTGQISGVPLSKQNLVRRVVRNAIIDARGQLPPDRIGIVCIRTLVPPPFELLDLVLHGLQRAEPGVLGPIGIVLVLPPDSVSKQVPTLLWTNPRYSDQSVLQQLTNELKIALA